MPSHPDTSSEIAAGDETAARRIGLVTALLLLGGITATRAMEASDELLLRRHPARVRRRERRLRRGDEGPAFVHHTAGWFGVSVPEGAARAIGQFLHYSFGALPCAAVMLRARRGSSPLTTGIGVALLQFVLIDEIAHTAFGLTPNPFRWPPVSHARGLLNHLVYGVCLGAAAAAADRWSGGPRSPGRQD